MLQAASLGAPDMIADKRSLVLTVSSSGLPPTEAPFMIVEPNKLFFVVSFLHLSSLSGDGGWMHGYPAKAPPMGRSQVSVECNCAGL